MTDSNLTHKGPASLSAINVDLLSGNVSGWIDVSQWNSGSILIAPSAGISAGVVSFEQTNDTSLASAGVALPVQDVSAVNASAVTSLTPVASTNRIFSFPILCKYIRARISTAIVGGTLQASLTCSTATWEHPAAAWQSVQSGTWTVQAQQNGTWTVQPGNTANTTAWLTSAQQNGTWTVQPGNTANTTAWLTTAQQNGTWTVQPGNTANTTAWLFSKVASAAQGASTTHHLISAATTNATSVKASAGTLNTIVISNASAAVKFFKLYNKASAPAVGTDTPIMTLLVPAGATIVIPCGPDGLRCSTGIAYALTGGITVADTTAVALSDLSVALSYT